MLLISRRSIRLHENGVCLSDLTGRIILIG
jgi:hypothetical protein